MSLESKTDTAATEGCAAAAGYADPVVTAIEKLESSNGPLEYETRLLLSLAKEAQQTGRMPNLSILRTKPVCAECNGLGGRYIGDPCHGTEGWQPCACQRHTPSSGTAPRARAATHKSMNQKSDSNNTAGAVAQERLVLPFFRVVVTKLEGGHRWRIVSNPKWCHVTRGQSAILDNTCNDYSEYTNCGCVYRMIRVEKLREYVDGRKFDPAWSLDPRQNASAMASADEKHQPKETTL